MAEMYDEAVLRLQRDPDVLNDIGDKLGAAKVRPALKVAIRHASCGSGADCRRG